MLEKEEILTLPPEMFGPFGSVWCKMALGEVGVSLLWWCHALLLLAPGYWRLFLNLKSLVHNGKLTNFRGILSQSWNSEVSAILPYGFSEFQLWLKIPMKLVIFELRTKGFRF